MGSEWGDWLGGCGLDSTGSGQGPVAGCCECGDEPSGSCATELVSQSTVTVSVHVSLFFILLFLNKKNVVLDAFFIVVYHYFVCMQDEICHAEHRSSIVYV
jgi:hypothetical protein